MSGGRPQDLPAYTAAETKAARDSFARLIEKDDRARTERDPLPVEGIEG